MAEKRMSEERVAAETAQGMPAGDRKGTPGIPPDPGVSAGGTGAGDEVTGCVLNGPCGILNPAHRMTESWDNIGEAVPEDPALAGTVAGNTTAAGGIDFQAADADDEDDNPLGLGPEGTTVQEIGGAAREG